MICKFKFVPINNPYKIATHSQTDASPSIIQIENRLPPNISEQLTKQDLRNYSQILFFISKIYRF